MRALYEMVILTSFRHGFVMTEGIIQIQYAAVHRAAGTLRAIDNRPYACIRRKNAFPRQKDAAAKAPDTTTLM